MFFSIFKMTMPLFFTMAAGFTVSRIHRIDEETLSRVLTDFFMPALVFSSLCTSDMMAGDTVRLLGATTTAVLLLAVVSFAYCSITGTDRRGFMPPVCFMNTGFLGIPLMELWGGAEALGIEIVIDQMQTFHIFTLGMLIVTGGFSMKGLREMIKTPLLWAIIAGFIVKFGGINISSDITGILRFGGGAAPALAAFTVGCSMSKRRVVVSGNLAAAFILRFAGGFAAGLISARIFGLAGLSETVLIAAMALPSAVFSYILPLRYGGDTELAGSMLILSTAAGIATIPFFFRIAAML